ncbi:Tad domain-containing protein [Bacillus dakarensis]|uniref:Tad domain-containing protein n=1 Tax=Robertmurraya dakarensis TaxID=1926278 RepID=UPI000980EBA2|nr:Tad domain-containing protein [Bacillus dakarensis]
MKRYIKNEKGSGVILTIFNFAVVGIMLILVLNIAMAFTKKEQASIAAEHASLAATSAIYDEVNDVVDSHVKIIEVEDGINILEPLIDKVEARKASLSSSDLSSNEIHIKAVNDVLMDEIPDDPVLEMKLKNAVEDAFDHIPNTISNVIDLNHGKKTDYDWEFRDYQINVEAKTEFEAAHHNGINFGSDQDISQVGIGPEVPFLESLGY